jgi:hypothetical protein
VEILFTGFEANTVGIRTGGTNPSGAVNDRILIRTTGLVYGTSVNQSRTTLGSFGTVGTFIANIAFSGSDMLFQVKEQQIWISVGAAPLIFMK